MKTLIQEFKSAVLEEDVLENQDNPKRIAILPCFINQHPIISVESTLQGF